MADDELSQEEAEQMWKGESENTLVNSEAPDPPSTTGDSKSLEEAVADALAKIDDVEESANEHLTTRDRNLSALFAALEEAGELSDLGRKAADALERDEDPQTKADVLRLLLRYAISDLDESVLESGTEGLKRYRERTAEDGF
ncbi:hypothetical protein ACFQGT_00190 [Natrialbaceae archaeon GCM10025810]